MFKDGITLKRTGWYIRLMDFMWGATWRNFPNLCPLFWGVIGSILIFPLWAIVRIVWGTGKLTWERFGNVIQTLGCILLGLIICEGLGYLFTMAMNSIIAMIWVGGSYKLLILTLIAMVSVIIVLTVFGFVITYIGDAAAVVEKKKRGEIEMKGWLQKILSKTPSTMIPYWIIYGLFWPIKIFFLSLWRVLVFTCKFIYSVYKQACPLIKWED